MKCIKYANWDIYHKTFLWLKFWNAQPCNGTSDPQLWWRSCSQTKVSCLWLLWVPHWHWQLSWTLAGTFCFWLCRYIFYNLIKKTSELCIPFFDIINRVNLSTMINYLVHLLPNWIFQLYGKIHFENIHHALLLVSCNLKLINTS